MDHDLESIQEARDLLTRAKKAQKQLAELEQSDVDRICAAMVEAGEGKARELARMAVKETGYGREEDKVVKNLVGTRYLWDYIEDMRTVGVVAEDRENKIVEIAEPMGVVAAVIPSTNPTSTAMYKAIISLKSRNSVVLSPHPAAVRCITAAADTLREAATRAGAPRDAIGCMSVVDMAGTQELMQHKATGVILATGGHGLVKAAYSAGKPAYGVGPGNVPAFIEKTADIPQAVRYIIESKTFDYGTLCSSEQSIITEQAIADEVRSEIERQGGYFLNDTQAEKLEEVLISGKRINPELVGQSPQALAKAAGFTVPDSARVLVVEADTVGWDFPLSMEKLSTTLTFFVERDWMDACDRCIEILQFGGMGHSLGLHSKNPEVIQAFAFKKPAFRIMINTGTSQGTVGFTTGLPPSMTLGCGTIGGNITADNITPRHLVNIKRVAWGIKDLQGNRLPDEGDWCFTCTAPVDAPAWPAERMPAVKSKSQRQTPPPPSPAQSAADRRPEPSPRPRNGGLDGLSQGDIRDIVSEVLKQYQRK